MTKHDYLRQSDLILEKIHNNVSIERFHRIYQNVILRKIFQFHTVKF